MHGQAERAPMHGQKSAAAEQRQRLEGVLRSEMNVAPGGVEGAYLQHHEIKRPQPVTDVPILASKAGIAAEKHGVSFRAEYERGPQSCIAVLESASREMLRWGGRHGKAAGRRRVRFPPTGFADQFPD